MGGLVLVRTALRRYAARRDDLSDIRQLEGLGASAGGASGQPYVTFELGALLDPQDAGALRRPQALVVPLRRRNVALLVERVEEFLEQPDVRPLPALLRGRLREPWATGVLLLGDDLVVQLDLRAVARTALTRDTRRGKPSAED